MPGPIIVVAPDKFKGTLTGAEAAGAMRVGVLRALPEARVVALPMADGGEGTVDAMIAAGGSALVDHVAGPLGDPVEARWAVLGDTAVLEMSAASGLALVTPTPDTALRADSGGTGELIARALDAGSRRIVIGIGGSATTDGGAGALRALGARLLDAAGAPLPPGGAALAGLARIDLDGLDPRLAGVELTLCTDVANPLTGPSGAAAVFGPQKGADPGAVAVLDAALTRFAAALREAGRVDLLALGWGGAGGGIAGGLHAALGARAASGVDVVADILGLDAALVGAGLVITGEGSIDAQSALGKTPVGVGRHAAAAGIPAIAVGGVTTLAPGALAGDGILSITTATEVAPDPEAARSDAAEWVAVATERAVRAFAPRIGERPGTLPPDGSSHPRFLRIERARWWKGALAILGAALLPQVIAAVLGGVAIGIDVASGALDPASLTTGAIPLTPAILLATNLSLAAAIPISMLLQRALYGQRPRWLGSVAGGIRRRWLVRCVLTVLPLWLLGVGALAATGGFGELRIDGTAIALLVIILLTTPLQAAGEEYAHRGLMTRAAASWFRVERVGLIVSIVVANLVFAAAHGATDPWLVAYYFLFGVVLGVVTWRTGGLEAGIALHAVNNVVLFVPAALTGQLAEGIDRSAGAGGPFILIPLAGLVIAALVIEWQARRVGLARTGPV